MCKEEREVYYMNIKWKWVWFEIKNIIIILEKNNFIIKIFKNILDNFNNKWYIIMKYEEILNLFNENEKWWKEYHVNKYQYYARWFMIILFKNIINIYLNNKCKNLIIFY